MPFAGWAGYAEHTLDPHPTANLTDFTFLVSLNQMPAAWWTAADIEGSGGDIRVEKSDGTRLPIDVIHFAAASDSGLLACKWTGSRTTTDVLKIRVWVGNAAASSELPGAPFGQFAAYDSFWRGFWPNGLGSAAGTATDRTSFGNTLTLVGTPSTGGATGPIEGSLATDLNGTTQYGRFTGANVPTGVPFTFFASGHSDSNNVSMKMMSLSDTAAGINFFNEDWRGDVANDLIRSQAVNGATAPFAVTLTGYGTTRFHRTVSRFTSSTARIAAIDGVVGVVDTVSVTPASIDTFAIGALLRDSVIQFFNGRISLISLHTTGSTGRPDAWIAYDAQMLNALDPNQSDFFGVWAWTAAASEGGGSGGRAGCVVIPHLYSAGFTY